MKSIIMLLLTGVIIYSCGNQDQSTSRVKVTSYTVNDTISIVDAVFNYHDSSGVSFNTVLESAKLDTISFIKNKRYNSTIPFPTKKVVKYIPLPEGYPRYIGRSDLLDLAFSQFEISGDSANCALSSKYINLIGDYYLKKKNGEWQVVKYIEARM